MSALAEVTKPAAQNTDDLDLVAAVRAGDDRAFELLYERYQARISVYVRKMVRDHGRAEDITQEVFIAALRRMRETDREIVFKPWIYEIAKNACIDAFRRTRHTSEVSLDAEDATGSSDHGRLASPGAGPDAAIDTKQSIDDLCGAFGGLSQQHHDILVMREFEGLSYSQIGDRLGMSRAGVESTLFRARRRLSEEYEELVSGERCLRVRAIADATGGRAGGLRDQRRLARHVSHCQPCRRYAMNAGVDVAALRAPAASVAAKIAALVPLPPFLRRRFEPDHVLSLHGPTLNVMTTVDPAIVSGWSKVVATAATVAVAGLGAGAAVKHEAVGDFISKAPSLVGLGADESERADRPARIRALSPAASRPRAVRPAGAEQHAATSGTTRAGTTPAPAESPGAVRTPAAAQPSPDASSTDSPSASSTADSTANAPSATVGRDLEVVQPTVPSDVLAPVLDGLSPDPATELPAGFGTLLGDLPAADAGSESTTQPRGGPHGGPSLDDVDLAVIAGAANGAAGGAGDQNQQSGGSPGAGGGSAQPAGDAHGAPGARPDGAAENPAKGDAADAGKPEEAGRPADVGTPADSSKPADPGKAEDSGQPADPGKPVSPGKPDDAGAPNGTGGAAAGGDKTDRAAPDRAGGASDAARAKADDAAARQAAERAAVQQAASGKPMSERARELMAAMILAEILRRAAAERP